MEAKSEMSFWVINPKLRAEDELDPDVKEFLEKNGIMKKSVHNNNMVQLVGPVKAMKALKKLIGSKTAS